VFHVQGNYALTKSSSLGLVCAARPVGGHCFSLPSPIRCCRSCLVPATHWRSALGCTRQSAAQPLAAWRSAALALFHLNGIAGDPYKTLTLALTGKMTVTGHGRLLCPQACFHGQFLLQWRLGRHLCARSVHGRYVVAVRWAIWT